MIKVGITGGIGSGKSTVCRMLAARGVAVYDSDARAKELMNADPEVVKGVAELLGGEAYDGGRLDRAYVASKVFTDRELLASLNAIVHPAVGRDFIGWAARAEEKGARMVVLESAILFESGFGQHVDYSVTVSAPVELRVERSTARDGSDPARVRERMASQMTDREREALADYTIVNDAGLEELEEQVEALIKRLSGESRR